MNRELKKILRQSKIQYTPCGSFATEYKISGKMGELIRCRRDAGDYTPKRYDKKNTVYSLYISGHYVASTRPLQSDKHIETPRNMYKLMRRQYMLQNLNMPYIANMLGKLVKDIRNARKEKQESRAERLKNQAAVEQQIINTLQNAKQK